MCIALGSLDWGRLGLNTCFRNYSCGVMSWNRTQSLNAGVLTTFLKLILALFQKKLFPLVQWLIFIISRILRRCFLPINFGDHGCSQRISRLSICRLQSSISIHYCLKSIMMREEREASGSLPPQACLVFLYWMRWSAVSLLTSPVPDRPIELTQD